jgi:hypothetical protein
MWELFQIIYKNKLSPNQAAILFGMKLKIALPKILEDDKKALVDNGYVTFDNESYELTADAKVFIAHLDNYFVKAKKKTSIGLLGKNYTIAVQNYRTMFPKKKLPSGKPARVNEKTLIDCFRWFFETYDYTWDQVFEATRMYVNEYRDAEYMYMQTSQYFICKQDKHKVKSSTLADYCDMIRDGIDTEQKTFKEKVV